MSGVGNSTDAGFLRGRPLLFRLSVPVILACTLLVSGCKQNLYSDLPESEANQMLAILMSNGIYADKTKTGATFTLEVENADMVGAIKLLSSKGYPKKSHDSIGDIFKKSGIISSPFEERVRYIYALGEEVAQTLSDIDGVVTARVQVVLPDPPQLGEPLKPASASVFIKHDPAVDMEFLVPQIRRLVSSSIEGLQYDAVTVVLTEATPAEVATQKGAQRMVEVLPGLSIRDADVDRFWSIVYAVGAVIALLLAISVAGAVAMLRRRRPRSKDAQLPATRGTALEPS